MIATSQELNLPLPIEPIVAKPQSRSTTASGNSFDDYLNRANTPAKTAEATAQGPPRDSQTREPASETPSINETVQSNESPADSDGAHVNAVSLPTEPCVAEEPIDEKEMTDSEVQPLLVSMAISPPINVVKSKKAETDETATAAVGELSSEKDCPKKEVVAASTRPVVTSNTDVENVAAPDPKGHENSEAKPITLVSTPVVQEVSNPLNPAATERSVDAEVNEAQSVATAVESAATKSAEDSAVIAPNVIGRVTEARRDVRAKGQSPAAEESISETEGVVDTTQSKVRATAEGDRASKSSNTVAGDSAPSAAEQIKARDTGSSTPPPLTPISGDLPLPIGNLDNIQTAAEPSVTVAHVEAASAEKSTPNVSQLHSTKAVDTSTVPLVSRQNTLEQPPATTAPTDAVNRGDRQLTEVERVRFVQRVSRAVQSSVDRGGEVRLRLSPPELGSLKVEIIVKQGVMNARLEAETPAARSLLLENLPMLKERLAEQNIRIDRFDVDLNSGFTLPDQTSDRNEAGLQGRLARQSGRKQSGGIEAIATPSQPTTARFARDGRLNVIV